MSKEKGFLAYYNMLILIVVLACITTSTLRHASVVQLDNRNVFSVAYSPKIESRFYESLKIIKKNRHAGSIIAHYKYCNGYITIFSNLSEVIKDKEIYIMNTELYQQNHRYDSYCLSLTFTIIDEKKIIKGWEFKYGS